MPHNRTAWQARKEHINRLKESVGCADCPPGTIWPGVCLDFDHVRGEKVGNISSMVMWGHDNLKTEIEKCEVVCANHHRIRTEERRKRRVREPLVV